MSTLMVFDTSYLYFRSFFGLPSSLRSPDGRPVNAIKGTLDAIAKLVSQYQPAEISCAWDDDWRPAWRTELVPSYKAHRVVAEVAGGIDQEESPDELSIQVPLIRELLEALGIAVIGAPEHEADDVLGTLATRHVGKTLVVTGDRDLFQLVSDEISVVYIGGGIAKHALVDDAWLIEKYGIPASRYADFAVLRGDPSDGLPGVNGIGEKSAAKLVTEYASLTELLQAASSGELSPSLCTKLLAAREYLAPAKQVVEVVRDLELPAATALPISLDQTKLAQYRAELGLGGSLDRIMAAIGADPQ